MHVWCCTDDTDAALLDIFGLAQDEGYAAMGSYMRKYVVFAAAEHTEDFPLLPIFPLQLSSLIRYGWYLQFHGVRGGIHSIRNYLSAITEANSAAGHPDPRAAEPWTWRKFRLNVPKHLLVVDPAKTKLALRVPHMQAVALDADYSRADDLDDLSSYALAWFSAVRVGHFAPKSRSDAHCQHLLRWKHVASFRRSTHQRPSSYASSPQRPAQQRRSTRGGRQSGSMRSSRNSAPCDSCSLTTTRHSTGTRRRTSGSMHRVRHDCATPSRPACGFGSWRQHRGSA